MCATSARVTCCALRPLPFVMAPIIASFTRTAYHVHIVGLCPWPTPVIVGLCPGPVHLRYLLLG